MSNESSSVSGRGRNQPAVDELRPVTLIHADIVGSTHHIRDLDEVAARQFLDQAIDSIRDGIKSLGGHVLRIQGDGVLAIFGATIVQEDHAWRAVLAAEKIRDSFAIRLKQDAQAPKIRLGIHSGPIYLRWQEHDFGLVLDAVGTSAHIAARVESQCRPNQIAISESVVALLPEQLDVQEVGQISSHESPAPIKVFELSEQALSQHLATKPRLGARNLFGREPEWQRIRSLVEQAKGGETPKLAIIGSAGMGKSRLLDEAIDHARQRELDFLVFRGRQLQAKQPMGALKSLYSQLVKRAGRNMEGDANDILLECGVSSEAATHMIGALEGDRYAPRSSQPVLPDRLQKTVIEGLHILLRKQAEECPLLLLCDDVQYLDAASLGFLADLVEEKPAYAIALLLCGREEISKFVAEFRVPAIKLEALSDSAASALVQHILNDEDNKALDETVEQIVSRSQGLPLALTEFANFTAKLEHQAREDAALPLKIDTIFRAKLDALAAPQRALCDIACVLGNEMPIAHLELVADLDSGEFNALLQSLLDSNVLVDRIDGRLQFSHQLFHEAAYAALGATTCRDLHAKAYERLNAARLNSIAHLDLARHAHNSGALDAALKHYWKAGQEAVALAQVNSALSIYLKAKEVAREIGDAAQASSSRFAMMAFDAAQQLAEQEECHEDLMAITTKKIEVDEGTFMVANAHQAMVNWIGGRGRQGLVNAQIAHAAITGETPLASRWYVEFVLGILEYSNSMPQESLKRLEGVVSQLSDGNLVKKFGSVVSIPGFLARAFGGWIASDLGEFEIAEQLCHEAIEIADRLNHNNSRLIGRIAEGHFNLRYGDADSAVKILSDALDICHQFGFYGYEPSTSSRLAMALLQQGNKQRAQEVVQQSLDAKNHLKIINSSSHLLYDAEARVLDAVGQTEMALEKINKAIDRCELLGDGVQAAFATFLSIQLRQKLNGEDSVGVKEIEQLKARSQSMGLKRLIVEIEQLKPTMTG